MMFSLCILQTTYTYLWIISLGMAIGKSQVVKHVGGKLLPHIIRVTIINMIVKKCIHDGNGSRPEGTMPPIAEALRSLRER